MEKKGIFPELLAPVGDWERLEAAVLFGADAVYLGGTMFGMRASAAKFGQEDMARAVEYCHSRNVRIYITLNVLPRNDEIPALEDYIRFLGEVGVDALIISDLGVFRMARRLLPDMDLHVSTQAGVVNYLAAREFCEMGAKRVVLARELSLEDIRTIQENTPPQLELEAFVHGAMCMSFSGRCLISQYLTGRDANHGECAQPCRWSYRLVEEKRQEEYYPVVEEEEGTYFFNAQDLNMLPWLDKLAEAGVTSFKIEGRAKSAYYVSVITNAYRQAVDILKANPDEYQLPEWLLEEPYKVSHREYCSGFYFPEQPPKQYYNSAGYVRDWDIAASVEGWEEGYLLCTERGRFFPGEELELLRPGQLPEKRVVEEILDEEGDRVDAARHPMRLYRIPWPSPAPKGSILRKKSTDVE